MSISVSFAVGENTESLIALMTGQAHYSKYSISAGASADRNAGGMRGPSSALRGDS
jgi:hypothetical protein